MKNSADNDFFSRKKKEIGIISIVLITVSSFGLFFYQQNITEQNVKNSIFTQHKDREIESTQRISEHISSDLQLIMSILKGIADSSLLQQGLLSGDRIDKMMREKFSEINNITKVDTILIADKDDITTYEIVAEGTRSFLNIDLSFREYIQETRNTLQPVFSNGFKGMDNIDRIALAVPIVNSSSGEYMGIVEAKIPTVSFFSHYGNIHDINSQFLVVYDRKGTLLAVGADKSLLGKNFFGEIVQNFTNHNPILKNLTQNLLHGIPGYAIYDYGRGERITTNVPVFIQDIPSYFVQIVTPTDTIYSEINDVLFGEKLSMFSLIVGTIIAITILIMFLMKWNVMLNNEVKKRTKELQESNRKLVLSNQEIALANEELKIHDKMQKEFINIASHEMKTPVQAILSYSQLLQMYPERQNEFTQAINRNSIRLQRLSNDILDVARIESGAFTLNKELFDLNEVISHIIDDYKTLIANGNYKVKFNFKPFKETLLIEADKERISEVVSNLLSNAIKFTKEGEIFVSIEKKEDNYNYYALVTVRDTGEGVDPEVLPNLFSKFITKSFEGIGLGLYISKYIVEAHGGKIWVENNSKDDNCGSIFCFKLPLRKSNINNNNFNN
ncbi:MAG TPA: sensor histidine kinase [Nitrososphaeraceae archaeon]|nr:sensor histidine kinase [Nitrososphaeraceae archaeon]